MKWWALRDVQILGFLLVFSKVHLQYKKCINLYRTLRCTSEIKSRIAMAKAAFSKKKTLFTSKLDLNLRKKLIKCYIWSMALYGAETWTLRAADQKYLESFEMWCWRRMEKISWTDHVRNEEVLLRVNEQRNILHKIRKRKANWIGHILRRNCLVKQVIEGKIKGEMEVTRRRGIRVLIVRVILGDVYRSWTLLEYIAFCYLT